MGVRIEEELHRYVPTDGLMLDAREHHVLLAIHGFVRQAREGATTLAIISNVGLGVLDYPRLDLVVTQISVKRRPLLPNPRAVEAGLLKTVRRIGTLVEPTA